MEQLRTILETARTYYHSAEYYDDVLRLQEILSHVRQDVNVAIDLDGTLTSRNVMKYGDVDVYALLHKAQFPEYYYLRRPLANEFIDQLVRMAIPTRIWTAVNKARADIIVLFSGLDTTLCPIITHEENLAAMQSNALGAAYGSAARGQIKVPSVHGVDRLLDDHAKDHQKLCRVVGRPGDASKIVHVPEFLKTGLDDRITMKQLLSHHLDRGLLTAAERLVKSARKAL